MVLSLEELFPACDDPHVLELEPYFRPGAYAELLRAKVSEFPSGSVSFFNKGMKFIELIPHYHSASIFTFPSVCEEACPLPPIEAMEKLIENLEATKTNAELLLSGLR